MTREALLEALRAEPHPLFVVGTGVSIGAVGGPATAPTATWPGLIRSGLARAKSYRHKPDDWLELHLKLLEQASDTKELIRLAAVVEDELCRPDGEWVSWLSTTVGSLEVVDPTVAKLVARLGRGRLATTNYDDVLTKASDGRLPPVPWTNERKSMRILRGRETGVVHLHGHWDTPESVVLGIKSYEDVLRHKHTQALQEALGALQTFVFVGFGDGLKDPNLGSLMRYLGTFRRSDHQHFRLCTASELTKLLEVHPPEQRVTLVSYGQEHTDLRLFLEKLCCDLGLAEEGGVPATDSPGSPPGSSLAGGGLPSKESAKLDPHSALAKRVQAARIVMDFTTGSAPDKKKLSRLDDFYNDFWSPPRPSKDCRFTREQVDVAFPDTVRGALARIVSDTEAQRRVQLCMTMLTDGSARIVNYAMTESIGVHVHVALYFFGKGVYAMLLAALVEAGEDLDGMEIPWRPWGSAFHHPRLPALYGSDDTTDHDEKLVYLDIVFRPKDTRGAQRPDTERRHQSPGPTSDHERHIRGVGVGVDTEVGRFFLMNPQVQDDFRAWASPPWVSRYLVPQMTANSFLRKGPIVSDFSSYLIGLA